MLGWVPGPTGLPTLSESGRRYILLLQTLTPHGDLLGTWFRLPTGLLHLFYSQDIVGSYSTESDRRDQMFHPQRVLH